MLGTLLDLLAGVVIFLSLLYFSWLGVAGFISPRLVGGRSRLGLLFGGVFGCAISVYLMTAITEAEPEPEPVAVAAPAPAPAPDPPEPPEPPDTAWTVEGGVANATGDRALLGIGVTCRGDNWIVVLDAVNVDYDTQGGTRFPDSPQRAYWKWDGRLPGNYSLSTQEAAGRRLLTTMRDTTTATTIVTRLRRHAVLELRVETILRDQIEDIFGLAGAAAAFDSLTCGDGVRPAPRRRPSPGPSFDMDTEAGIVATLLGSSIGSSVGVVMSLMAGYEPTPSRSGEQRRFTYRFDDGSGLVLVFVPPGGPGTGLVLDDIIVR